jgi:phosphoribosylaminoimidazolecarboxamide formyltransferase / IMP cyclohydrolase
MSVKKIKSALISVFHKDKLDEIVKELAQQGVEIYSTGGTQTFIEGLGISVKAVEDLTGYPSILGGRVKTLHPKVFGGILNRRDNASDQAQVKEFDIPNIDLVIVDLYPFEETVAAGGTDDEIIEKIDIGGIALIRGAAKNFEDVVIVPSKDQYSELLTVLKDQNGETTLADRMKFTAHAFNVSSHYDSAIFNWFSTKTGVEALKVSMQERTVLRYGENPHQTGVFNGNLDELFDKLNGKELSYNNLIDLDAAIDLINEFEGSTTVAILKHNNACGIASDSVLKNAYLKALQSDPISAFGGVIIANKEIDLETAEELHKLFFEILIAPSYSAEALELLKQKKNRILLVRKETAKVTKQFRTLLNGVIEQDKDLKIETEADLKTATNRAPSEEEIAAMLFANKVCKHTKSNAIVFATGTQMITSGVGQTSRVDALKQAIEKAKAFGLSLEGCAMASDAFFPFPDCVEIAKEVGIKAVIQPGGSIKDQDSIDYCDKNGMAMVLTGTRHFKH